MKIESYSAFVAKAMPESKAASANKCLIGHYFLRPVSHLIAMPLVRADVPALFVTKISMVFVFLALAEFMFANTLHGFILAWFFLLVWNILDGVDGDIARYTETMSPKGGLWDATVGWLATVVFYIGMGCAASRLPSALNLGFFKDYYLFMGCVAALCWIFPRLVMHKKLGLFDSDSVASVQDREHYGPFKLFYFNLTSINGAGALAFLFSMCAGITDICLLAYLALSLAMASVSCISLLK